MSRKPMLSSEAPSNPTKYWGTIYGTSGERIGAAFIGENDGSDPPVVVPRLTGTHAPTARPRRARIFVGKVQDVWGVDKRRVKEIKDNSPSTKSARKGKGKAPSSFPPRMYVGKKPPRHSRPPSSPDFPYYGATDFDSAVSPTSSRESSLTPISTPSLDWPEPDVGESAHFGFHDAGVVVDHENVINEAVHMSDQFSLSPGKLTVAITAGLGALFAQTIDQP